MELQQNLKVPSKKCCTVNGHQKQIANHICIFEKCDLDRWICIKCVLNDKHLHGQKSKAHIIDQEKFYKLQTTRKKTNDQQYKEQFMRLQDLKYKLKGLVQETNIIVQWLENDLKASNNSQSILLLDKVIKMTEQDFSQISNKQIGESIRDSNYFFLGYSNYEFQQKMRDLEKIFTTILKDIQRLKSIISNFKPTPQYESLRPQSQQFILRNENIITNQTSQRYSMNSIDCIRSCTEQNNYQHFQQKLIPHLNNHIQHDNPVSNNNSSEILVYPIRKFPPFQSPSHEKLNTSRTFINSQNEINIQQPPQHGFGSITPKEQKK